MAGPGRAPRRLPRRRPANAGHELMRAAVTQGVGSMVVLEHPEPAAPGPGEVVIRPEAVGICGSDYHFFAGDMSDAAGGGQFPRIQGHALSDLQLRPAAG